MGRVYLVGAGPGDPELITRRGYALLMSADAVVYDHLIPHELIMGLPPRIERHDVGKQAGCHTVPQEHINELLAKLAGRKSRIVRLKGGDPFVFGRGGEEALYLAKHGIPFSVVPGVTAGIAGPAYAGIPITHRGLVGHAVFVTGHESAGTDAGGVSWSDLARLDNGTLVGYMGVGQLPVIVESLIAEGMPPDKPAAIIERATTGSQRTITARLAELPRLAEAAEIKPPALFVVGEVVCLHERLDWFAALPLFGCRVLIPRPDPQADNFYSELRLLGADVLSIPLFYVSPDFDRRAWARLQTRTRPGDWLCFFDGAGVENFLEIWRQQGKDIRGLSVFSIAATGIDTLTALNAIGINPDLVDAVGTIERLMETMAAKLNFENRRIVIVKGDGKNEVDESILISAGAEVIPLVAYHRRSFKLEQNDCERLNRFSPNVVILVSDAIVEAAARVFRGDAMGQMLTDAICITVGIPATKAARARGIIITHELAAPTIDGVVDALVQYFS